jgi:hypothetical protein
LGLPDSAPLLVLVEGHAAFEANADPGLRSLTLSSKNSVK